MQESATGRPVFCGPRVVSVLAVLSCPRDQRFAMGLHLLQRRGSRGPLGGSEAVVVFDHGEPSVQLDEARADEPELVAVEPVVGTGPIIPRVGECVRLGEHVALQMIAISCGGPLGGGRGVREDGANTSRPALDCCGCLHRLHITGSPLTNEADRHLHLPHDGEQTLISRGPPRSVVGAHVSRFPSGHSLRTLSISTMTLWIATDATSARSAV